MWTNTWLCELHDLQVYCGRSRVSCTGTWLHPTEHLWDEKGGERTEQNRTEKKNQFEPNKTDKGHFIAEPEHSAGNDDLWRCSCTQLWLLCTNTDKQDDIFTSSNETLLNYFFFLSFPSYSTVNCRKNVRRWLLVVVIYVSENGLATKMAPVSTTVYYLNKTTLL